MIFFFGDHSVSTRDRILSGEQFHSEALSAGLLSSDLHPGEQNSKTTLDDPQPYIILSSFVNVMGDHTSDNIILFDKGGRILQM